jgi:hypothetical protein
MANATLKKQQFQFKELFTKISFKIVSERAPFTMCSHNKIQIGDLHITSSNVVRNACHVYTG